MADAHYANPTRRAGLTVLVADEHGRNADKHALGVWLARVMPQLRGVIHVALVSDARIRVLNRKFRGKNAATDVLSFPVDRADPALSAEGVRPFLGDIVIAEGVAERQAKAAGHHVSTELRILMLHGLLHLLGYDHEHDDGRMRRMEARLRRKGGLPEGLIERTRDSA